MGDFFSSLPVFLLFHIFYCCQHCQPPLFLPLPTSAKLSLCQSVTHNMDFTVWNVYVWLNENANAKGCIHVSHQEWNVKCVCQTAALATV